MPDAMLLLHFARQSGDFSLLLLLWRVFLFLSPVELLARLAIGLERRVPEAGTLDVKIELQRVFYCLFLFLVVNLFQFELHASLAPIEGNKAPSARLSKFSRDNGLDVLLRERGTAGHNITSCFSILSFLLLSLLLKVLVCLWDLADDRLRLLLSLSFQIRANSNARCNRFFVFDLHIDCDVGFPLSFVPITNSRIWHLNSRILRF